MMDFTNVYVQRSFDVMPSRMCHMHMHYSRFMSSRVCHAFKCVRVHAFKNVPNVSITHLKSMPSRMRHEFVNVSITFKKVPLME